MKRLFKNLLCGLALLLSTAFCSYASHVVGGEIHYMHLSDSSYKITVNLQFDCNLLNREAYSDVAHYRLQTLIYDSNSFVDTIFLWLDGSDTSGSEVSSPCSAAQTQCTDPSSAIPGIKTYTYSKVYTLPHQSTKWRFIYNGENIGSSASGRSTLITNISLSTGGGFYFLEADLNSLQGNSTTILNGVMPPYFCINSHDNYAPLASDVDGDSVTFNLIGALSSDYSDPLSGVAIPCIYQFPYTPTAPLATSFFSFSSATGAMFFIPNLFQRAIVVYEIEERRSGILVGTSQREMTVLVENCDSPCMLLATPKVDKQIELSLYPNPINDQLNIEQGRGDYNEVVITNAVGTVVLMQQLDKEQTIIDTHSLSTGMYFATLKGTNGVKVQQLVVMR